MKLRKYETLIICRPELSSEQFKELVNRLKEKIESTQGKLLEVCDWGLRKLAYPIKRRGEKFFYGHYFLLTYAGNGQVVKELEDFMKLIDETFRFQTVKLADKVEAISEEIIWREQVVPEVRLREDGEGLEVYEPPRERKVPREKMFKVTIAPSTAPSEKEKIEEKAEEAPSEEAEKEPEEKASEKQAQEEPTESREEEDK